MGRPAHHNAQYVVQPYYVPANVARFAAPPGTLTHTFRWEPRARVVQDGAWCGRVDERRPIAQHEFTSGVPIAGDGDASA